MDIEIRPVAITQIDWNMFIDAFASIDKNPINHLDAHHMKTGGLPAFLASLIEGRDPRQTLRNIKYVLKHASASFMIKASLKEALVLGIGLDILQVGDELFIVSGNFLQWKDSIIDLSKPTVSHYVRYIMNCCQLIFEKAELHDIWGNYSKETLPDKTFTLNRKA